jgi:glycosyltransferase involved in cell wall biosynthesis
MSTYKRPDFLRSQLKSLLKQTFTNFQIIISDNDTSASAESIVKEINDPRISYECNGENLGMIASFNKSIKKARSKYIVTITDDDPVDSSMLADFHRIISEYPGYSIYLGCHRKTGKDAIEVFKNKDYLFQILHPALTKNLLWSSGIIKTSVVQGFGGIPDFGSPHFADHALLALSGKETGGVLINKMYSSLSSHNENFSKKNFELYYIGCLEFYKFITQNFDKSFYIKGKNNALLRHLYRWFIANSFSLRKYFTYKNRDTEIIMQISDFSEKIMKIPFMRNVRFKYYFKVFIFFLKRPLYRMKILR